MDNIELKKYQKYRSKVESILKELQQDIGLQIQGKNFSHSEESKKTLSEANHFFIHGEQGLALDMAFWFIVKYMKSVSKDLDNSIRNFLQEFNPDDTYLGKEIVDEYLQHIESGKINIKQLTEKQKYHEAYRQAVKEILEELDKFSLSKEDLSYARGMLVHGEWELSMGAILFYISDERKEAPEKITKMIELFLAKFKADDFLLTQETIDKYLDGISSGDVIVI